MASRLIIDGNSVYEIDEDCEKMTKTGKETRNPWEQRQKTARGKHREPNRDREMALDESVTDRKR